MPPLWPEASGRLKLGWKRGVGKGGGTGEGERQAASAGHSGLEGAGRVELPGGAEEVVPIFGSGWDGPGWGVEMAQRELVPRLRILRVPDSNTW